MTWWPLLLGWPAMALSFGLAVAGILRRNEFLALAAIVPIVPLGFYLLGSPVYWWLPFAVLLALLLTAWSIRHRRQNGRTE